MRWFLHSNISFSTCLLVGVGGAEAGVRLPREPSGRVHEEQDRREGEGESLKFHQKENLFLFSEAHF